MKSYRLFLERCNETFLRKVSLKKLLQEKYCLKNRRSVGANCLNNKVSAAGQTLLTLAAAETIDWLGRHF